jgi:uncharacterized RDD family membrane protein YckC
MNTSMRQWFFNVAIASLCILASISHAQNAQQPASPPPPPAVEAPDANAPANAAAPAVETPAIEAPAAESTDDANYDARKRGRPRWGHHSDELVTLGGNSTLPKGEHADSVVSVFGSSTSDGDVSNAVVSVFGDTRVSGTVGDAAVAVFGDTYVNAKVAGDVVAVLGNVELGPAAEVQGNVVSVGGAVRRDPASVIHGGVENIFGMAFGGSHWLRPWVKHCLHYLRPLAIAPGLGWAWALALGFLALYALIALMFRDTVDRCVRTLETRPGQTVVAALLGMLLTPVLFVLLCITVIGIAFVPFAALGLFMAGLFGKAVVLAWIGRFFTKLLDGGGHIHTAFAVLAGGGVVLALYLVPVVGFFVYKALGILGFGVAVYALILAMRSKRGESRPAPAFAAASPGAGSAAFGGTPDAGAGGAAGFAGTADSGASAAGSAGAAGSSGGAPEPAQNKTASAPFATAGAAHAVPSSALPRAGFAVRMAALFIDAVLIAALLSIIDSSKQAELLGLAIYGAVMWKFKATTIGGIVFGLQVVRVDGRPIDWATAIVRALSCFLSLIVAGLGFIWIAFDENSQAWHDKIAGTVVVRVPKGVSLL